MASTVGLMVMHIVGFDDEDALPYAIKLASPYDCNILRDVGEDWANGWLYLPLTELAEFGLTEADIASGFVSDAWRAFMRFHLLVFASSMRKRNLVYSCSLRWPTRREQRRGTLPRHSR